MPISTVIPDNTYLQVTDGTGDASLMHVTATRLVNSTTLAVDTLVGVPSKFIASVGTPNAQGFIDPTTVTNFFGHINGGNLIIDGLCPGSTDTGNTTAQIVVIKPNTFWAQVIASGVSNPSDWGIITDSWAYASVDGPTGVITVPTGAKSKYSAGKRIKITQTQPLTSYWPFDSNSSDTKGSNNGTDTAMTYTAGKFSNAATFNGSTSKIVISDTATLKPTGPFTVGFWMKTTDNNKVVFQSYSGNTNIAGFYINFFSHHLSVVIGNNTGTVSGNNYTQLTGSAVIDDGNFHYVVMSFQNNWLQVYVDGVLDISGYSIAPVYAATNYIRVGCGNGTGTDNSFFTGQVDDLFVINGYALGEDAVAAKYAAATAQTNVDLTLTKYALITKVTDTTVSAYFGTDYALVSSTITNPQISGQRSPLGFPVSPTKWTTKLVDILDRVQNTPTVNVYVNFNTNQLSVPIGAWKLGYQGGHGGGSTGTQAFAQKTSLSTANNAETDPEMTSFIETAGMNTGAAAFAPMSRFKDVVLTAKTTFYLIGAAVTSNASSINLIASEGYCVISAVSNYL